MDQPDSSPQRSNSNPTSRRGSAASEKMVKVDAGPMPAGEDDDDELADEDSALPCPPLDIPDTFNQPSRTASSLLHLVGATTSAQLPYRFQF